MIYDNPRSKSFTNLCPTFAKFISSKNTRPFDAKFYRKPPWDVGMKTCSNVPCHMTKMASRPYMIKTFKISFFGTKKLMTLKFGIQHWVLKYYLFKWWHCVDLDYFYDMVKSVSYCFCMGDSLYSLYPIDPRWAIQDRCSFGFRMYPISP